MPKHALPQVLQAVGFTGHPASILLVQEPDELGLRGYPRDSVTFSLSVAAHAGTREVVTVTRWLVQLGFGEPVLRVAQGQEVTIGTKMKRMSAKFGLRHGWTDGVLPASLLVSKLVQYIPDLAIDSVQSRANGSFAFLCHEDHVDTLLCASGKDGLFIKCLSEDSLPLELLWLDPTVVLEDALNFSKQTDVCLDSQKRAPLASWRCVFGTTTVSPSSPSSTRWTILRAMQGGSSRAFQSKVVCTPWTHYCHRKAGATCTFCSWTKSKPIFSAPTVEKTFPCFGVRVPKLTSCVLKRSTRARVLLPRKTARQLLPQQLLQLPLACAPVSPSSVRFCSDLTPMLTWETPTLSSGPPNSLRTPLTLRTKSPQTLEATRCKRTLPTVQVANAMRCVFIQVKPYAKARVCHHDHRFAPFFSTMSGQPVRSLSARLRNKRMHALNGNSATPPANLRPGYQQPQHSWLHVATLNATPSGKIINRFICVQIWHGAGDTSFFVDGLYCPSGGRWEAPKKAYTHRLLQAVQDDIIQRGNVSAILCGDNNLDFSDSVVLRRWFFEGPWHDTSALATSAQRDLPTCHHGKGSRIDFLFVTRPLYDQTTSYETVKPADFPTHSAVSVRIRAPQPVQVRRTQKPVSRLPFLAGPHPNST